MQCTKHSQQGTHREIRGAVAQRGPTECTAHCGDPAGAAALRALQRLYDSRCRDVWQRDPEVLRQRRDMTRLRRKELRLHRYINTALEEGE